VVSQDLEKAKALLAEAGYPDGFNLELDVFAGAPYRDIGEALQANFAQAGIKVSVVASDRRQVLTKYRARNHQAVLMVWSPDYGDPHSTMDFFLSNPDNSDAGTAKTAAWRNSWFDPELKELADKAIHESDTGKRKAIYADIQRSLQTDSPFVVMFQQTEPVAMRSNVENWVSGPAFDTYVFRGITK
jgi:peptide/nickel transport system substrate-binding protein